MSLKDLRDDPWKKSHVAYANSAFNIRPAPEFSTAEVVVASTYRAVGFAGYAENEVPKAGRDLDRASQAAPKSPERGKIRPDTWRTILHGVLESPKQPNQSSKRFLQLCPVVPDVAIYSGSARPSGRSSWNPGSLIQRMICLGAGTEDEAKATWSRLFDALSVSDNDDIWARWLGEEFERRAKRSLKWQLTDLEFEEGLPNADKEALVYPAKQFVVDLEAVISAKTSMTRRQWVSLLEAVIRLGSVMHVIWLCNVNEKLWREVRRILDGANAPAAMEEVQRTIVNGDARYLAYGNPAVPIIKEYASGYLSARIGLNVTLWALEEVGVSIPRLTSSGDLLEFLDAVARHRKELQAAGVLRIHAELADREARAIACKKGIGSNLIEFARHTLGQRQTSEDSLRGYDQSYFLRKRGDARNAPWVVSLGPVALLAMVHCCLRESAGPRSVERLRAHLGGYGVQVDLDSMGGSDLGLKLRMLGLVLDSPDAESGMLMIPPFVTSSPIGART